MDGREVVNPWSRCYVCCHSHRGNLATFRPDQRHTVRRDKRCCGEGHFVRSPERADGAVHRECENCRSSLVRRDVVPRRRQHRGFSCVVHFVRSHPSDRPSCHRAKLLDDPSAGSHKMSVDFEFSPRNNSIILPSTRFEVRIFLSPGQGGRMGKR